MIDKNHIESILKINGLGTASPDEQIRSVLLSARFNKDEVDAALMVLRENTKTNKTRVDGLHKVFRSDQTLEAQEISALLGIDMDVSETVRTGINSPRYTLLHVMILWVTSILIAVTAILYYMYTHHIGFFHPTTEMVQKK